MTTNAEIKVMFQQIMATQKEITEALQGQNFRKINTVDAYGNPIEFEPDLVFQMIGLRKPVKDKPNTYTAITRLMLNRANNGNLIMFDLDGTPTDVRRQIGGPSPIQMTMEMPEEFSRVTHEDLPAITQRGPKVTEADGTVWTIATNDGNKTLRNGEWFGGGQGTEYVILKGVVYVLGTNNDWYEKTDYRWAGIGSNLPTS